MATFQGGDVQLVKPGDELYFGRPINCDRCGKILKNESECFVVEIKPPEIWTYFEGPVKYYVGTMHFCQNCMDKLNECIDELGRND